MRKRRLRASVSAAASLLLLLPLFAGCVAERRYSRELYGLFDTARVFLKPGGALYVVMRKQQGAPSALKYLREIYASAEIIDRGSGFHVMRAEI